jgi:hypothetical protein
MPGHWLGWLLASLLVLTAADLPETRAAETVRRLPYPFSHMISFASDADAEMAWHGRAIHRVINDEIGLPIGSSIWIHGHGRRSGIQSGDSYLFQGIDNLNRANSGVDNLPVFALLLRDWHKGYYDHIHGWQDDSTFQIRNVQAPPVALTAAVTTIELPVANSLMLDPTYRRPYQHLRLYFDRKPPADLHLQVFDANGKSALVPRDRIDTSVQVEQASGKHIVEALFYVPQDLGVPVTLESFDVSTMRSLKLMAPSCARGCDTRLLRIDRDTFSRRAALHQVPYLEAWNIRPPLSIDHGGYSMAQNFAIPGFRYSYQRVGAVFGDKQMAVDMEFLADDPTGYAYLTDLLKRIGVTSVTPYGGKSHAGFTDAHYPHTSPNPSPNSTFRGLHNFPRASLSFANDDTADAASFRRVLIAGEPLLAQIDTDSFYCPRLCFWPQGVHLGLLTAVGLQRAKAGEAVEQMWYTHFATGDPDWKRTAEKPLKDSAVEWLRELAHHYYNFDGSVDESLRVWVPSPGVFARYRIVRAALPANLRVDAQTSAVTITPWTDPVTGLKMPDLSAGSRDLHGITIYVPDAAKARLFVSATELNSFTRNRPDRTGRPSISIVGDSAPTPIAGEAPLRATGSIELSNLAMSEAGGDASAAAAHGKVFVSLTAQRDGTGLLTHKPYDLQLSNITHLRFAVRKLRDVGQLAIEIVLPSGKTIAILERATANLGAELPEGIDAGWWIGPLTADQQWQHITVALDQLSWRKHAQVPTGASAPARPPLPLGRIAEIRLRMHGQRAGGRLDLDDFVALRPSSNGIAPNDGKLIAGRVTRQADKPVAGAVVSVRIAGHPLRSTVSDRDGLYYFHGVPRDSVMQLEAAVGGVRCAPQRGHLLEVRRDDAEVDIDLDSCRAPQSGK